MLWREGCACVQFIQPKDAKIVQKPPRTTSQASKPPSGKAAGSGPAGGGGEASTFSGSEGVVGGSLVIVEAKDERDAVAVPSGFSIVVDMLAGG